MLPTATARSRAELDRQMDLGFDPLGIMPRGDFPPHPRVFATPAVLERARKLVRTRRWAAKALQRLIEAAENAPPLPQALPVPTDQPLVSGVLSCARRNALAYLVTDRDRYRGWALDAFDLMARDYPRLPVIQGARGMAGSLAETHFNSMMGFTYDLLEACALDEPRRRAYRAALVETRRTTDTNPHYTCLNHNTHNLAARLTVGAALGELQDIHDALYGWRGPAAEVAPPDVSGLGPPWRYGLVHQLQHDFLADGCHWERSPSYHMYVLGGFIQAFSVMENLGVDLWGKPWPPLMSPDGEAGSEYRDQHRGYGPEGEKFFKTAFDAIIYQAASGGQLSLLGDTGLITLCSTAHYGMHFSWAYQKYRDGKYAWLTHFVESQFPRNKRPWPGLPMSLQNHLGDVDWIHLETELPPRASFRFADDARIGVTGENRSGCSLFPTTGRVMLRSDPDDPQAPCGSMFWGPHSAGHQSPAALHVDFFGANRRAVDAPHSQGYEDPAHLLWVRTTIAHNTVTVDEGSMFPYDRQTESTWEADTWRDRPSDGRLECFQPEADFKVARASNDAVYPGVRLDRTLIVTRQFILDVFGVLGDREHQYDWAMHCLGRAMGVPKDAATIDLGRQRGYRFLGNARAVGEGPATLPVRVRSRQRTTLAQLAIPASARLILAEDPPLVPSQKPELGTRPQDALGPDRTAVIVRARAKDALFVSLWQIDPPRSGRVTLASVSGAPSGPVTIRTATAAGEATWLVPLAPAPVERQDRRA